MRSARSMSILAQLWFSTLLQIADSATPLRDWACNNIQLSPIVAFGDSFTDNGVFRKIPCFDHADPDSFQQVTELGS